MAQNTFHVAISVKDLPTAIERYRQILGVEPAKVKPDYAKFEIADPPVILSLNLGSEPGTVSHLGIRYPESQQVIAELARTKGQNITVREQPGTTCCYAKADKFWVHDADGLEWEMYTLLEDADVHTIAATPEDTCCSPAATQHPAPQTHSSTGNCGGPAGNAPVDAPRVQSQAKRSCC